jgi:outer membrane protein OmpA-like peptidoglycan-associated protein
MCLLFLSSCALLTGQQKSDSTLDVTFDAFKGTVYYLPEQETDLNPAFARVAQERGGLLKEGRWRSIKIADRYSEKVYDYTQLGEITLDRINVPETIMGHGKFPGVERSSRFGMILHSTMYVGREGCYEFSLSSDDGSLLWIDHVEVVNNDGGHGMRRIVDSAAVTEGVYGVKLWYFQGLPDRFGCILDARRVGDMTVCDSLERRRQFELNSTLLFDFGKYTLTDTAKTILNTLLSGLPRHAIRSIEITGHTDAIGCNQSNQILSQRRADAIAEQFKLFFHNEQIDIIALGKGESEPKATNDTEAGREENRRVEINVVLKNEK